MGLLGRYFRNQLLTATLLLTWRILSCHGWTMLDRRTLVQQLLLPQLLQVLDVKDQSSSSSSLLMDDEPDITDQIFLDLRIARQDGSTYVRDDLPDIFENRVINARLTLGLFGKQAPK